MRPSLGTVLFSLLVPGTAAVLVPWLIASATGARLASGPSLLGGVPLALGLLGYGWCATDFVRMGRGTPAPIAPPRSLVVRGLYRFTRNPMYVSVLLVVVGQAILLASIWVIAYGIGLWVVFHLFVLGYEEPNLSRRFGPAYDAYRRQVPRWLPRWP
jgi:protein-S-isoprenylcysteine O-methyltransferase Ste14